jgi:hypothetical protein
MAGKEQQVKILVYWDDDEGAPTAATTVVNRKKGKAKLEWVPDDSIKDITNIKGLDPTEFTDIRKAGKKWKGKDECSKLGHFSYVIEGTKADGTPGGADPTIRNEDE